MIAIDINKRIGRGPGSFRLQVKTVFQFNSVTRILGPSGVGKSTLLKILAGFITPDSGLIKFGDAVWFDSQIKYSKMVQERNVGFVFQDYALFPNMTVAQHLHYGSDNADYINQLLELGELTSLKERLPRQLSGGQQQRLAILRALSTKPKLLLMDEPFAALDSALKIRIMERLKSLFEEQQTTVLMVTHQDQEWEHPKNQIFNLLSQED
ncbi:MULTISPECIES: sulfate/molybdate ABC transporter ATP-binding protein [Pedobacter]|uniref:sulfate/molybdate ABC transporter ATP-binding protein n=1 Tax=Pedobacter TaxID=84567 RepID=UPI001E47DB20|nr:MULTISPECIES: ATP-binding cassette domain-containing protein [Pedobacter]